VRRELVFGAVTWDERDPRSLDGANGDRRRGLPPGRPDLNLLDVVEKGIKAGSAEYADSDRLFSGRTAQADFSLPAPPPEDLLADVSLELPDAAPSFGFSFEPALALSPAPSPDDPSLPPLLAAARESVA
jgi:hypothetical protein